MEQEKRKLFSGHNLYLIISVTVLLSLLTLGTLILGPKIISATKNPEQLRLTLGGDNPFNWLLFVGIQFVQVLFAFIPGEFVEIAAGYIYGSVWGTILCLVGVAPASCLIFGLTRLLGNKFTNIMLDSRDLKRLKFLQDEKKLTLMFFLLYFLPGTPKDLITYFAGITKIKFIPFLIISVLCRIPSILTSTLVGDALLEGKLIESIIIFSITGIIVIVGWFTFHKLSSRRKERKQTKN